MELGDHPSLKWEVFYGKKNTDEILMQKAFALAEAFKAFLKEDVKVLQEKAINELDIEITNDLWWSIYYDFVLFLLHISDRESFILLDSSQRSLFINALVTKEIEMLSDEIDEELKNKFEERFFENFVLFQEEFGMYGRTKTENISYMFAERIVKRLGHANSAICISRIFSIIITAEVFFNIPLIITETDRTGT